MLTALLDRYWRSTLGGFPWKRHADLLAIVENGLVYRRKHNYLCETCGFTTKGLPRQENIIHAHLQEAIDCQTALPSSELVWPFVYTEGEIKQFASGLGWNQAQYEMAVIRRLMGNREMRQLTWEEAFFDPVADGAPIRERVAAGLWHNARNDTVECAFCPYVARTVGANHVAEHAAVDNCAIVRYEEYAAMALLAPLEMAAPVPHAQAPADLEPLAHQDVAMTEQAADGTSNTLDSTVDNEPNERVFSAASKACPASSSKGLLSTVVRRLEHQGFANHRIIKTLAKLPEDQLANIDAFYVVDAAAGTDSEATNDDYACTICFIRQVSVMPNGCGDFKFCNKCLPDAGNCPLCRLPYDKKITVHTEFLS